jgi:hypothetical protein
VGREGAFFLYQLNVHTFNCHHRTDRRVEGLVAEGWVGCEVWVGGRMGGGMGGLQKLITFFSGWAGLQKLITIWI